ncbi:MFS transporter [Bacillus sp. FJAT-29953]|nr:MFS transporter [Bacillus sp. FJAT-29953]
MQKVNVGEVINESKITEFHKVLLILCCCLAFFDGFELGLPGPIGPVLIKEWSLLPVVFGSLVSYGSFGMILGALMTGLLSDRIGRKNVLITSAFLYSFFTLMGGFSTGPTDFGIYRFIAGMGMGGIVPTVVGLTTDYSPKRTRNFYVTLVTTSIALGATVTPLISVFVIPDFGWRVLFYIGGLPLLVLPFVIKFLPEAPIILVKKGQFDKLSDILNRLSFGKIYRSDDQYEMEAKNENKVPFIALFQNKRALSSTLIWNTYFFLYMVNFGLVAWLPSLMVQAGYPLGSSLLFGFVIGFGGLLGSLFGGKIANKTGLKTVVISSFILGALGLMFLGYKFSSATLLYIVLFIAGWGTNSAQNLYTAFVSQFYPTEIRATGLAFGMIWGRVGSFFGPIMGGLLLQMNLSIVLCFLVFGGLALIGAVSTLGITDRSKLRNVNIGKTGESTLQN